MKLVRSSGRLGEPELRAAYTAHGGELYGFALRSLNDPSSAEDVVQETFLRAWRSASRFDPALAPLRTWLFAILRNLIIDQARARNVRRTEPSSAEPAVGDDIDAKLQGWVVEGALARLSDDHRRVVVESYYRHRPAADIAAELGIPIGTVRTRLFYGLKALALALDEMGFDAYT